MTLMPRASIARCRRWPAAGSSWRSISVGIRCSDGDVHAAALEAGRGLEAEQAAADDHRLAARLGGEQHRLHVVEIAVGEHAGKVVPGNRNDDGVRAGGDDELVVSTVIAGCAEPTGGRGKIGRHRLGCPVDLGDLVRPCRA